MLKLMQMAENVALSRAHVLISGESGTGKELFARFIHIKSPRAKKPFIAVNCAAIPGDLLESELFGHEKGSFTGAYQSKPGKFELANDGTFLLDEISEMPLLLQAKLLRVIQEGEVERIGGKAPTKVNVRLIATTNRDLRRMVQEGKFHEDLYYRINVVPIEIPPLRTRLGDITLLANFFCGLAADKNERPHKKLSIEALQKLNSWTWPGNVRELQNVIERAFILGSGEVIGADSIEVQSHETSESDGLELKAGMTIEEAEKLLIEKTLKYTNDNRTKAAELLGISVRALRYKLNDPELVKEKANG
jgi:two-component system response regulator FlrC